MSSLAFYLARFIRLDCGLCTAIGLMARETILNVMMNHFTSAVSCRSHWKKIQKKEAYWDVNALPRNFLERWLDWSSHSGTTSWVTGSKQRVCSFSEARVQHSGHQADKRILNIHTLAQAAPYFKQRGPPGPGLESKPRLLSLALHSQPLFWSFTKRGIFWCMSSHLATPWDTHRVPGPFPVSVPPHLLSSTDCD